MLVENMNLKQTFRTIIYNETDHLQLLVQLVVSACTLMGIKSLMIMKINAHGHVARQRNSQSSEIRNQNLPNLLFSRIHQYFTRLCR